MSVLKGFVPELGKLEMGAVKAALNGFGLEKGVAAAAAAGGGCCTTISFSLISRICSSKSLRAAYRSEMKMALEPLCNELLSHRQSHRQKASRPC